MKKLYRNYIGLFYFTFFAIGSMGPLLASYLKSIGLNGTEIGLIVSVGSLMSIFFQPFWGIMSDRTQKPKMMIVIIMIGAAFIAGIIPFIRDYRVLILGFGALYLFQSGSGPLVETMALNSPINFGKIRQWGSIGFAMAVLIAGVVADYFGLHWIFPIYSLAFLFALLFLKPITTQSYDTTGSRFKGIKKLLRNKRYILFIISSFFIMGTLGANNTYFGILYEALGGSITGIGIAFLLFAGSEAPFMTWTDRWIKRWGIENILVFSAAISTARWFWYSTGPSPMVVLLLFVLQGISVGTYLVGGAQFIGESTSDNLKTTAMTLYGSIGMGLGGMVCKFLGGVIYDYIGILPMYVFLGLFTLIGLIPLLVIKYKYSVIS